MVWGAISKYARSFLLRIESNHNSNKNVRKVLQPEAVAFLQGILGANFEQDTARPHVANTVRIFCSAQHIQLLPWSAYLTDMYPIEHVWDLAGCRLARDPHLAASNDKLWLKIQAIWNFLSQADILNLHAMSYSNTYCSAWWLHQILISDTYLFICLFFALEISSCICTQTSRLCIKFHLIPMIPSWCCILYKQLYKRLAF